MGMILEAIASVPRLPVPVAECLAESVTAAATSVSTMGGETGPGAAGA